MPCCMMCVLCIQVHGMRIAPWCPHSSVAERILGKNEVPSSTLGVGSTRSPLLLHNDRLFAVAAVLQSET